MAQFCYSIISLISWSTWMAKFYLHLICSYSHNDYYDDWNKLLYQPTCSSYEQSHTSLCVTTVDYRSHVGNGEKLLIHYALSLDTQNVG